MAIVAARAAAQEVDLTGTLHLVWDTRAGDSPEFFLTADDGTTHVLIAPPGTEGRLTQLDRKRVVVRGTTVEAVGENPRLELRSIQFVSDVAAGPDDLDFVTLLCAFPDRPMSFGAEDVREIHTSTSFPGMPHYFRELSGVPDIMAGNEVHGWFIMPSPADAYITDTSANLGAILADCTQAADPTVDFSGFYGINVQLNAPIPFYSGHGGAWPRALDGPDRLFGITVVHVDAAQSYPVFAHEIGHAFGWPHSDCWCDVMSYNGVYVTVDVDPWGPVPQHTIAYNKQLGSVLDQSRDGWIPAHRRWVPAPGIEEVGFIARSALGGNAGYLIASIPLGADHAYTAEARIRAGYDAALLQEGIIVQEAGSGWRRVIDGDGNGDILDAGTVWTPGEEFIDTGRGVSIAVDSAAENGLFVSIYHGDGCHISARAHPVEAGQIRVDHRQFGACGRSVTLTVVEDSLWQFEHWADGDPAGPVLSTDAAMTFTLASDQTLFAVLHRACVVTLEAVEGGSVAIVGDRIGDCGRTVTITATASDAWLFTRWTENGATLSFDPELPLELGADAPQRAIWAEFTRAHPLGQRLLHTFLTGGAMTDVEAGAIDRIGNGNGSLDVGDIRAFLDAYGL